MSPAPLEKPPFWMIWQRIEQHEGHEFQLPHGQRFTYQVQENDVIPSTAEHPLTRTELEGAFKLVPLPNTTLVQRMVAPAYLYAILMDPRIRRADW